MIKIRHLSALDAIVRTGSYVEAARTLHVTPAALSLAIRELEQQLGFAVLERTTRHVWLSDAGRGYMAYVRRILSELDQADQYAKGVLRGHGVVRIATTHSVIASLLPSALPELQNRWPNIRVQLLDISTAQIAEALLGRQADLAIGVRLPSDDHYLNRQFFTSRWMAYVTPHHRLGKRRRLTWSDLVDELIFTSNTTTLDLPALLDRPATALDRQDCPTAAMGLTLASAGHGVAVFPGYAQAMSKVMGLRSLPIHGPAVPHVLEVAVTKRPSTLVSLDEFVDCLVTAVQSRCAHLS